jgi:hypothetical protein
MHLIDGKLVWDLEDFESTPLPSPSNRNDVALRSASGVSYHFIVLVDEGNGYLVQAMDTRLQLTLDPTYGVTVLRPSLPSKMSEPKRRRMHRERKYNRTR